jgi:hypothetical protein
VLGALLGFIAGAVAVCLIFIGYRKRSKSYNTHESDGTRRSIEYYSSPSQSFVTHNTRPVPVQPNIFKLTRQEGEEEQLEGSDVEDGAERVRVTEPYDLRAMDVIKEEGSEVGSEVSEILDDIGELNQKTKDDSSVARKKKPLTRGLSLPTNIVPSDLIHHSQSILNKSTKSGEVNQCVIETSMFYDTASKELHVTVIQVAGIPTPDESFLRPPNCSVKMRILPEMLQWQWTRKISRTVSPVFNETFIVPGFVHNKLRECTVHFVVLDFDHVQDNVYVIGEVFMPLSELRANKLEKISKRVNPLSI